MLPEGRYDLAAPADAERAVLVLHPHPAYGGDRFHPVVDAVHRAAADAGWASIRPDLAAGDPADATAEAEAALALLPEAAPVVVVGYSFGAAVGARLVGPQVRGWVLVAPPFGTLLDGGTAPAGPDGRPKLLLVPAHDQFCPPDRAREATAGWAATEVEVVEGADHFLAGAAAAVARRARDWAAARSGA